MANLHTTFSVVSIQFKKRTKCCTCHKYLVRRKTFWQTINPYNKNKQGRPKDRPEIHAELVEEGKRWILDRVDYCRKCAPTTEGE